MRVQGEIAYPNAISDPRTLYPPIIIGSIGIILAVPFTTLWWFSTHAVHDIDKGGRGHGHYHH